MRDEDGLSDDWRAGEKMWFFLVDEWCLKAVVWLQHP